MLYLTTATQERRNCQDIIKPDKKQRSEHWKLASITDKDKKLNIKELFTDFNDGYTPIEIEWGCRAGKEIW